MKTAMIAIIFLTLNLTQLIQNVIAGELKINPKFSKITEKCKNKKHTGRTVYFFKQWHLASSINTKEKQDSSPQEQNLEAIYLQLNEWVKSKSINTIVAEGCTGTIESNSDYKVNGWRVSDLEKIKYKPGFQKIGTSVPLKIEAKYGNGIQTICGDDTALVKEQLLAFSDASADVKYLSKILENKNNPSLIRSYLDDVIQFLKLPKSASVNEIIQALKNDFNQTINRVQDAISKRNKNLVKIITSNNETNIAVVFGGMHAEGVKQLLEEQNFNCHIIEPEGYKNDEDELLNDLSKAVNKIK